MPRGRNTAIHEHVSTYTYVRGGFELDVGYCSWNRVACWYLYIDTKISVDTDRLGSLLDRFVWIDCQGSIHDGGRVLSIHDVQIMS
jgi:hypothetical protein